MIIYGTIITRALLYTKVRVNAKYRSVEYLLPQSLYRISCPLVARRTNTLLTTFVVNVPMMIVPVFFYSHGISYAIDLECCVAHTL